jgi:hypothetical protein
LVWVPLRLVTVKHKTLSTIGSEFNCYVYNKTRRVLNSVAMCLIRLAIYLT